MLHGTGGAYERMVSLVKSCIKKSYRNILLDYSDCQVTLYQIIDIINSRPLTYVADKLLEPSTPNNFLRIRKNINTTLEVNIPSNDRTADLIDSWRNIKCTVESFWSIFRSHY